MVEPPTRQGREEVFEPRMNTDDADCSKNPLGYTSRAYNMNSTNALPDLDAILARLRDDARNNRDLGDRFERLMLQYFQVDPLYASLFSEVWMWNDWPKKGQVGDVGIDLVAQHKATGEYFAIQCKFYLPEHTLSNGDLDSFFTALGKPQFSKGIIVSTTDNWGRNALDALNQTKHVARISLHDLEQSPIDWNRFDTQKPDQLKRTKKNTIRPHQKAALEDVIKGLAEADRGKLIMACGTGKTFTALRFAISELFTTIRSRERLC
jgi:predicted helicase